MFFFVEYLLIVSARFILFFQHIRYTFSPVYRLEDTSHRCSNDYLAIYNGPSKTASSRIGKYCGRAVPSGGSTSGNQITIYFHTDGSLRYLGFQMTLTKMPGRGKGAPDKPSSRDNPDGDRGGSSSSSGSYSEAAVVGEVIGWVILILLISFGIAVFRFWLLNYLRRKCRGTDASGSAAQPQTTQPVGVVVDPTTGDSSVNYVAKY